MRMKRQYFPLSDLGLLIAIRSVARAENWPQWRGPAFNGSSSEKNLPENLDEKGALWSVELPGRGASTPIVWGERIFLTTQGKDRKLMAHCFDAKNGQEVWQKEMGTAGNAKGQRGLGRAVGDLRWEECVVLFQHGDLACFDMEGKQIWALNIQKEQGPFNYQWIYGSSPLLYRGKLVYPGFASGCADGQVARAKAGRVAVGFVSAGEGSGDGQGSVAGRCARMTMRGWNRRRRIRRRCRIRPLSRRRLCWWAAIA
jgi:hypothetical protein